MILLTMICHHILTNEITPNRHERYYQYCVERIKCPNDDKQLDELNEQERKETYLCRVKRHIQCCIEPEDE